MPGLQESQLLGTVLKGLLIEKLEGYGPVSKIRDPYVTKINKYQNGHGKSEKSEEVKKEMATERKPDTSELGQAPKSGHWEYPVDGATARNPIWVNEVVQAPASKPEKKEVSREDKPGDRTIVHYDDGSVGILPTEKIGGRLNAMEVADNQFNASVAAPSLGREARPDQKQKPSPQKGSNPFVRVAAATALAIGGAFGLGKVAQTGALGEGPQDAANNVFGVDTTVTAEPRPTQNVTEQPGGGVTVTQGSVESTVSPATETPVPTDVATETSLPKGAYGPETCQVPENSITGEWETTDMSQLSEAAQNALLDATTGSLESRQERIDRFNNNFVLVEGIFNGVKEENGAKWSELLVPKYDANGKLMYFTTVRSYMIVTSVFNGSVQSKVVGGSSIKTINSQTGEVNDSDVSDLALGQAMVLVVGAKDNGQAHTSRVIDYARSRGGEYFGLQDADDGWSATTAVSVAITTD